MNIGRVFEEDGVLKLVAKLGDDGWPHVRRFASLPEMLTELRVIGSVSFNELVEFCIRGLQPKGELVELPGHTEEWAFYLEQGYPL